MSRTIKGHKPCGYDYWTARPGNICGGACNTSPHAGSTDTKKYTNTVERLQGRRQAREALTMVDPTDV